jgi:DNA repair and recombination RAD54-like protein
VYRLLTTGTLEERILQRQIQKKSLSNSIIDQEEEAILKTFDIAASKKLFELSEKTSSEIHDGLKVL